MEARPASTGTSGGRQNGAGADVRIGPRIFQTRDAPPAPDKSRLPLAPKGAVRRRPGLY